MGTPFPCPPAGDRAAQSFCQRAKGRAEPSVSGNTQPEQRGCCGRDTPLDAGPETGSLYWSFEAVP